MTITDQLQVIDTDTHVTEPPDLWTSRLPRKWTDLAPHVEMDPEISEGRWVVGDKWLSPVGYYMMAGWKAPVPSHPLTIEDGDRGAWDPVTRLQRMDEYGIRAQILYANVISFNLGTFMNLEPGLALACVQAYNDFLTEFAATDPHRLYPLTVLPFWDLDATVAEMGRGRDAGHRGVVFAGKFEQAGFPHFTDEYWDRFYAAAQDMEQSINFHAGFSTDRDLERDGVLMSVARGREVRTARQRARMTGSGLMPANAETISHIVTSGLCDRFPRLKFVSVESGFGYVPYLLDSLDWHWHNYGVPADHPSSLLPSEYFRRQVYGTFWFERSTLPLLEQYADNMMFETDYPHPTSLSPGPASAAMVPKEHIDTYLSGLAPDVVRRVLHDNAAALYRID